MSENAKGRLIINPKRFPRESSAVMCAEILLEFPAPPYNPRNDGSHNPGESVLYDTAKYDTETLRERCTKHGLLHKGDKHDLVRRLYRHWRSAHLQIGFPLYGYGPGYEKVCVPSCTCGGLGVNMKRIKRFPRIPKMKGANGMDIVRFPRAVRFPRTNEPTRFPRLPDGDPRIDDPIWMLKPERNDGN